MDSLSQYWLCYLSVLLILGGIFSKKFFLNISGNKLITGKLHCER